ncbi:ATP-dependent DNA helicase PIF1 [Lasiodiplodia hormozganensis]|uniref:ATP-dependent DNA helicase n=1 Tax=Lasiodiplodia hormozganensis TaxID=869390 RepID=A0AA39YTX0_9PEZI|nr:ATP-dependent DNA helicase PIF1 [Lasiodiplodia hormozganensis]
MSKSPAGTGKSLLLRNIIEGLEVKYLENPGCVAITASTGLAAYNIGGTTLHRFAGIGVGKAPTIKLIKEIFKDRKFKLKRWRDTKILIIDEISMVDSTLFDKLDVIARIVRQNNKPFGGIQLVLTGDFFQLPPVLEGPDDGSPRFCFEAESWKTAIEHTIGLTQIYRQKDPAFAGMLNEMREGLVSPSTINAFRRLNRPLKPVAIDDPEATELFPLRREADAANQKRMHRIKSPVHTYLAKHGGIITDPDTRKKLLSTCTAPEVLQLKQTAQVMLIKNIDDTLVNGSLGRVIGFANKETFFHGRWHREVQDEYQELHPSTAPFTTVDGAPENRSPLYPVVRFQLRSGNTRTVLCKPERWAVERWVPDPKADGGWVVEELATRTQVPLILAWALSIHKSQGQTLDLVKVDLGRVFETGQAYVALSRATSMDGLQVLNFNPRKVTAHPKVKAFYESLSKP